MAKGKALDLTGRVIGRLTVLYRAENKGKSTRWHCKCACGNTIIAYTGNLAKGTHTTSCGCHQKEVMSALTKTHGHSYSKLYFVWTGIMDRCNNPLNSSYKNYGGVGVKVCERWQDLNLFFIDMEDSYDSFNGSRPTLERLSNSGNYSPENCQWVEKESQNYNTSLQRNNKTGVNGVSFDEKRELFIARWREFPSSRSRAKAFNIKTLGHESAFHLACEHRIKMIDEQILKGAPYSINHGKQRETHLANSN